MSNNYPNEHYLQRDRFTERFNEALDAGGLIHLPPMEWLPISEPLSQRSKVIIQGNGAQLKQAFDPWPFDGAMFTHRHNAVGWHSRDLVIDDLTLIGESDSRADGFDMANANRTILRNVSVRDLDCGYRVRTVGPSGQCEHNHWDRIEWSQCHTGIRYETNPDKPKGGHKGQKVNHATGHETAIHVHVDDGASIYTSDFTRCHFWANKNLGWQIGFVINGSVSRSYFDGSFEVAWRDRLQTKFAPIWALDGANFEHSAGSFMFVGNDAEVYGDLEEASDIMGDRWEFLG